MKFFLPLALLAAAGVSAATTDTEAAAAPTSTTSCGAQYILDDCLKSTNKKKEDCDATDNECLCYAWQAVATCYNNCPDDPSAASVGSAAGPYCSAFTRTNTVIRTAAPTSTTASATTGDSATATDEVVEPTSSDNSAADLARNTGGILLAVAGVVAAML